MKRLSVWLLGAFYGLLTISGINFPHNTTPADSRGIKISNITKDTPLYLEHSSAISSNPADIIQSQHYSHSSHSSHYSHESHQSHYSHYSSR
jgi:hypothetical protein